MNSSLINFPDTVLEPSSDLGIKLSQVKNYLESQKAKIVTAKTDEEFETEYNNMVSTLEDYSIADIDAAYNEVYQKNCENTGNKIEPIEIRVRLQRNLHPLSIKLSIKIGRK